MSDSLNDLKLKKLKLEIHELGKPFWQKTGFLVPLFAALISIILGYYSGWFDVQTKLLEIKRANLNDEIIEFQREKELLKKSNLLLVAEQSVLLDQVNLAKKLRQAQASYISTEVLRFKELIRRGEFPECRGYDDFFIAIEDRLIHFSEDDFTAEMELIEFEVNNEDQSLREQKLIEYMQRRDMLDEDGCFEDQNGETHCTNF